MPGLIGTITSGTSSICATSAPWSGPAPPIATSENSLGSMPRCTVRDLIALAMLALSIVKIPSAASKRSISSLLANSPTTFLDALTSNDISPPKKSFGSRRPSTRLASVTVGFLPPSPYAAGPGIAPALCGPTLKAPPLSK